MALSMLAGPFGFLLGAVAFVARDAAMEERDQSIENERNERFTRTIITRHRSSILIRVLFLRTFESNREVEGRSRCATENHGLHDLGRELCRRDVPMVG